MRGCPRTWEVEAARDGRLKASERQSLALHVATCPTCGQEQHALEELGAQLCRLSAPGADELRMRRTRQRVLARANELRFGTRAASGLRRWRLTRLCALAACIVGVVFGLDLLRRHHEQADAGPRVVFEADPDTRYQHRKVDGTTIVDLIHGRLTLHIQRGERDRGVLVRTPDGELEDVGTVFTVDVAGAHTRYVSVREGRVLMRLKERAPRVVEAGESLHPYDEAVAPAVPPVMPLASPLQSAAQPSASRSSEAEHSHHHRRQHTRAAAAPLTNPDDAGAPSVADEFTYAVGRLEAGELGTAAALFHRFVHRHPDDVRAEDAGYLRVVALMRAAHANEARAAAVVYLRQYPDGFRAKEVERMLRDTESAHGAK